MKSELLLPVGNLNMALAAIHNGANAVYVGMPGFNARGRTHDHSFEELKEIIDYCHLYNVEVHVAFNILIFQNELARATDTLKKVLQLGPDAMIVQDLGLIRLINSIAPQQTVHGSTQMTVTNHEAINLLSDLSISRFVLGRENSLEEIKIIKANTEKELEVFVHGALCVAYSGQCFTSEALGGRSANRGQCAQSCRFSYDLIVDGKTKDLKDLKYLVSPQDLCGINDIPKLLDLGIDSFKVEGRLKSPEFVASVAKSYRSAIDQFNQSQVEADKEAMGIMFSRGFYNGWLGGVAHQKLVDGSYSSHHGVYLGVVQKIEKNSVFINASLSLNPGDGILLAGKEAEVGGQIYKVENNKIYFNKNLNLSTIKVGDKAFINSRDSLSKELKKTYSDKNQFKRIPINVSVVAQLGKCVELTVNESNYQISCQTDKAAEKSVSQSLSTESIMSVLQGLSHTPYIINEFECSVEEGIFINNKELKLLKQKMVSALNSKRLARVQEINNYDFPKEVITESDIKSHLTLVLRDIEQLHGVLDYLEVNKQYKKLINYIVLDYEFGKDFFKSVKMLKDKQVKSVIATTRILKPNEYHNFKLIERANPNGLLIRNLGALNYFKDKAFELYGDFSLNVTNSLTFDYLISKNLRTICASYDLDKTQLDELIRFTDTSKLEITIHQYMPEFHMEHCVFAAFLSKGNSFRDCGKPCEEHHVQLKDMYGNMHEIKADQECRNTMYSAKALSATSLVTHWQDQGVSNFRFEALHEKTDELVNKIDIYLKFFNDDINQRQVIELLGRHENYGVTTGQLLKNKNYKDRKKLSR